MSSALTSIVSQTSRLALNPLLTAALLWTLTKSPLPVRDHLLSSIPPTRRAAILARAISTLKTLLVLGTLTTLNRKLNTLALNAYRLNRESTRWHWPSEVAVVIGGASGIGALVVARLARAGLKVAVLDIQPLPPNLTNHPNISFYSCDVSSPAAVTAAADKIRAALGVPSVLVNNAGITVPHRVLDTTPAYLTKIFGVNLFSNWYTAQAFVPDMVGRNKGHVVTVASLASFFTCGGMADYCATKAGVLSFHEGLTQELAHSPTPAPNILLTSIHPSWVRTPLLGPLSAQLHDEPMLEPSVVADAIVAQILKCEGAQIVLPRGVTGWVAALVKAGPNWAQEVIRGGLSGKILEGGGGKGRERRSE